MIRPCDASDFEAIWSIVNDGAQAYKGVIPSDRWSEPYMTRDELRHEMEDGVRFCGFEEGGELVAVMGSQPVLDVMLIRHAYVRSDHQKRGLGTQLLRYLVDGISTPVLIGTWSDAIWAIRFYERHGFQRVDAPEKSVLLKKYWNVPERQIETSVVLGDERWREQRSRQDV